MPQPEARYSLCKGPMTREARGIWLWVLRWDFVPCTGNPKEDKKNSATPAASASVTGCIPSDQEGPLAHQAAQPNRRLEKGN